METILHVDAELVPCDHHTCDEVDGFRVCCDCGLVISAAAPKEVEWRLPSSSSDTQTADVRQRASNTGSEWDHMGTLVGDKSLQKMQHGLCKTNQLRVYTQGCEFICNVCTDLQVGTQVESQALEYFWYVRDQHARWRGARRIGILIACVSIACQRLSVGISDAMILKLDRVKQPTKTMNAQKKAVLLSLHTNGITIQNADASHYCLRVCADLGFDKNFSQLVSTQVQKISKMEHLHSRSCGMIVAVSILHLIETYNLSVSIKKLCKIINVTRPTLFKWYADASKRDVPDSRQLIQFFDNKNVY